MKKVPLLLLIFGIAYFCLELIPQFTPDIYINAININDLVDLLITIPLTFTILMLLFHYLKTREDSEKSILIKLRWVFLGAIFVMLVGDAMHYTANSIYAQVEDETTQLAKLIYFYDEMLGHFLLYLGLYIALVCFIILQYYCPSETPQVIGKKEKIPLGISAGCLGFILCVGPIEGQQPYVTLTFVISILILTLYLWRMKQQDLWKSPVTYYMFIFSVICLFFMILYPSIFGGYFQPSEIGII